MLGIITLHKTLKGTYMSEIRKPLNQDKYHMRIIKDLGMAKNPTSGKRERRAIFECMDCKAGIEMTASNARVKKHCPICFKKHAALSRVIPLKQEEFKMKIIEDLGKDYSSPKSTKKAKCAIFECTFCKKHFKARASGEMAKKQTMCNECFTSKLRRTDHPLYHIWNGIKQRCYSPKRKDYDRYGGIGVTMADEWKEDPVAFIDWCEANGWNKKLQVDKDIKCRELSISPAIYSPETLSFITCSANCREAHGRTVYQYTLDGTFIEKHQSPAAAGEKLQLKNGDTISSVCRGKAKTTAGFKWSYTEL